MRSRGMLETLPYRQRVIEAVKIREIAYAPVDCARRFEHIHACNFDAAKKRQLEPREATKQCCLAGAVRSDQCSDAAGLDLEADVIERANAGIFEQQVGNVDRGGHVLVRYAKRTRRSSRPHFY